MSSKCIWQTIPVYHHSLTIHKTLSMTILNMLISNQETIFQGRFYLLDLYFKHSSSSRNYMVRFFLLLLFTKKASLNYLLLILVICKSNFWKQQNRSAKQIPKLTRAVHVRKEMVGFCLFSVFPMGWVIHG